MAVWLAFVQVNRCAGGGCVRCLRVVTFQQVKSTLHTFVIGVSGERERESPHVEEGIVIITVPVE